MCEPGDGESGASAQNSRENSRGFHLGPVGRTHAKTLLSNTQGKAYKRMDLNSYTCETPRLIELYIQMCITCLSQDKFFLRCVQFYPNHNCDTVVSHLCVITDLVTCLLHMPSQFDNNTLHFSCCMLLSTSWSSH